MVHGRSVKMRRKPWSITCLIYPVRNVRKYPIVSVAHSCLSASVAFIHGPQGSGKTRLLASVLKDSNRFALFSDQLSISYPTAPRKTLTIDVSELSMATSEMALVARLANQTGYWPVFSFLNSLNSLIDLASVGLIGQKSNFLHTEDFFIAD